jgi:hypothetical protein
MHISLSLPPRTRGCTDKQFREARAYDYQNALNAQARINADWVLREWRRGVKPACCAKCNKTRYVPDVGRGDGLSGSIVLLSTPELFQVGRGSCGSIAACHTGHKIAEAYMGTWANGRVTVPISWDDACTRYVVQMRDGPDPTKPMLMHAICNDDGTLLNPTEGMLR